MNILITGGAGFIGTNLVEKLLTDPRVSLVRVLDDFSTGLRENVEEFQGHPKYEFLEGDICDFEMCTKAMKDIQLVSHQAALGSVPRSIENPIRTNTVNIGGTLNILKAAVDAGVKRVILACSSSTYGDHPDLPKIEDKIGNPLSPYAVTKATVEQYAAVFKNTYGLDYVGLRYFNIFGPRQSPDNPYAAVIPLFCRAFLKNESPTINGDGATSRDFTYVDNAVQANVLSLFTDNEEALNQIYNIACGEQTTLNEMITYLRDISGKDINANHGPARSGDIRHSLASIDKAKNLLGYRPDVFFKEGLSRVYSWYQR
jgi:UDP-N-acetylglucosamine 4-epimerase